MSSFRTFFRAVVMLAALGLLAKAWYHYGLTLGELQAVGGRGAEVATELWEKYWQTPATSAPLAVDDQPQSTTAVPPAPFVPPRGPLEPTRLPETTAPEHIPPVQLAGTMAPPAAPELTAPPADPLQAMIARLDRYGARDQQLTPWGGGGELVRFSCRVPWGGSPNYSRQFEAVAPTPLAAVEQVAAEIEAWHSSR